MEIKKTDAKGRITIGEDGIAYSVTRGDGGAITLHPLKIPAVPKPMGSADLRAVYVNPSRTSRDPDQVVIYSSWGNRWNMVDWLSKIAVELMVPVVVDSVGMGAAIADEFSTVDGVEVIRVTLPKSDATEEEAIARAEFEGLRLRQNQLSRNIAKAPAYEKVALVAEAQALAFEVKRAKDRLDAITGET